MRTTALVVAWFVIVATCGASASVEGDGDLLLRLRGRRDGGGRIPSFELRLRRRGGAWLAETWGVAWDWARTDHVGTATVREEGSALGIDVDLPLRSDGWRPAGRARFAIRGKLRGEGFEGEWEGAFNGTPAGGEAKGSFGEPWPPAVAGRRPLAPEEHPRLFLRGDDVEQIRAFAATEMGDALRARLDELLARPIDYTGGYGSDGGYHAAGHAVRHLLTGEPEHAERAGTIALRALSARLGVDHLYAHSHPALGVAIAYDLCYAAWSPELRREVARYLDRIGRRLVFGHSRGFNANAGSNWNARCRGSGGVALLAIEGDPLPPPRREETLAIPRRVEPLEAPAGERPAAIPIGRLPAGWAVSTPLPLPRRARQKDDARRFGYAVGLVAGQAFELPDGERLAFAALPEACLFTDPTTEPSPGISLTAAHDHRPGTRIFLHVRGRIEDPGVYAVVCGERPPGGGYFGDSGWLWLNGTMIREGLPLRLEAGPYELLVADDYAADTPTARRWLMPRFVRVPDNQECIDGWRALLAQWREDGGRARGGYWIDSAARHCHRWLRAGAGDRCWLAEGDSYGGESLDAGVVPFALAYRNAYGGDLASGEAVEWLLPLYALRAVHVDGELHAGRWGRHHGTDFRRFFPLALPVSQARHRAALIGYWLDRWGPDGDGSFGVTQPHYVLFALASRFWQTEPAPPGSTLPLALHDGRRLYWAWRDRYRDAGDCVVELHARGGRRGGWWAHDAGAFRLRGLGHGWAMRDERDGLSFAAQNTLQIDGCRGRGSARLLDRTGDGSGPRQVRLDTGPVYALGKGRRTPRGAAWADPDGRHRALRCLLVDFAEEPRVFLAVGDRIEGFDGRPRTWQLWVPLAAEVRTGATGFTVIRDDAVLEAGFRCDAAASCTVEALPDAGRRLIRIQASPGATRLLVVMALSATGDLDPASTGEAIRCGRRLLRWEGDRLELEERP